MPNPAFIVDGHTEQAFLGQICPGKPIRRTNLNGKSVTIEAIAKKIASLIRLLGNRHYPIIVVVDRENRNETTKELCALLLDAIENEGIVDQDLRIGFADKMIENWILADYELLDEIQNKPEETDGLNGASMIKKIKGSYSKVIDGADLLGKIDKTIVYKASPSFRDFVNCLDGVDCNYLEFEK